MLGSVLGPPMYGNPHIEEEHGVPSRHYVMALLNVLVEDSCLSGFTRNFDVNSCR